MSATPLRRSIQNKQLSLKFALNILLRLPWPNLRAMESEYEADYDCLSRCRCCNSRTSSQLKQS
ncbi:hypothetical protein LINPERPRIM_LOCUS10261 [Linum perenne]